MSEVGEVLKSVGETASDQRIKQLVQEVDLDANGTIEFDEFCTVSDRRVMMICVVTLCCSSWRNCDQAK